MKKTRKFWTWRNTAGSDGEAERELALEGTIADVSWFDDDLTPAMFRDELSKGTGPITVRLNSPGGDVIAASQIYTMLKDYKNRVTVKIDGIAASAASVVAMAGDTVIMAPTAMMMIHDPMTIAMGNKEDLGKAIEMLDEVKESIINAYQMKTGLSRAKISALMTDETWLNARKALQLKFADSILGEGKLPEEEEDEDEDEDPEEDEEKKAAAKSGEKDPDEEEPAEPDEDEGGEEEDPDEDEKKSAKAYSYSEKRQMSALIGRITGRPAAVTGVKAEDLMKRLELLRR